MHLSGKLILIVQDSIWFLFNLLKTATGAIALVAVQL